MDGTGCWRDNVFVERLWKSIKYEEAYLHAYETINAAQQELARYLTFYNQTRPHRALDSHTPNEVYIATCPHGAPPRRQTTARRHLRNGTFCPNKRGHFFLLCYEKDI